MNRLFAIALLVLAVVTPPARAWRVMGNYDLDSLVYLSKTIVRAEIENSQAFNTDERNGFVHTVRVLDVFTGSAKTGDELRVNGLNDYYYPTGTPSDKDAWSALRKGAIAYLFLIPNGVDQAVYLHNNADWTVLESGVRLQEGESVYSFSQKGWDSGPVGMVEIKLGNETYITSQEARAPTGFLAMTKLMFPKATVLTQKTFEDQLQQSQQTFARTKSLMAGDMTPDKASKIVEVIRSRAATWREGVASYNIMDDALIGILPEDTISPEEAVSLMLESHYFIRGRMEETLQTSAGRSYLLDRIADPKVIHAHRLEFARILADAGWKYKEDIEKLKTGEIKNLDTHFAARLARLALANLPNDPPADLKQPRAGQSPGMNNLDGAGDNIGVQLLDGVADCAQNSNHNNELLVADLHDAATILSDAYPTATQVNQFCIIEILEKIESASHRQVAPSEGPTLTFVEPDFDFDMQLMERKLHLMCNFRGRSWTGLGLKLVLRPADHGSDIEIPVNNDIGMIVNYFGENWPITVTIPDKIAGKYVAFLRAYRGNDREGEGLGFEVEIPKSGQK